MMMHGAHMLLDILAEVVVVDHCDAAELFHVLQFTAGMFGDLYFYLFFGLQFVTIKLSNKYECTMDQELAYAAAYVPGRRCMCT